MTTPRNISPIGQRLLELLKREGLSQNAASLKAGLSRDAIRNIIRAPDLMPNAKTVIALAEVLGTSPEFILTGDLFGNSEMIDRHDGLYDGLRYGGIVEAGAFRRNDSLNQDAEYRTIPLAPDPRYPAQAQFAFEVMGDSMDRAKMLPGMWVQAVDVHAWERIHGEPGDGRFVIVAQTRNGDAERELTVKRLRLFRDRVELQPERSNPVHKPITFPLAVPPGTETEAQIIAVVISSHWIYT